MAVSEMEKIDIRVPGRTRLGEQTNRRFVFQNIGQVPINLLFGSDFANVI